MEETPLQDEYYDFILRGKKVSLAKQIAYKMWSDVNDRRGIKWEFQKCDDDIKESILQNWIDDINRTLKSNKRSVKTD